MTLVESEPGPSSSIHFSSSSLDNTDISLSTDPRRVLYAVRSPDPSAGVTNVYNGRGGVVAATLRERLLLSDTITFGEGVGCSKIKVDKWMKKDAAMDKQ